MPNFKNGLLFDPNSVEYISGSDTPSDLKLDCLLPRGTAELFRIRPTEQGFLDRREFFTALLSDRERGKQRFTRLLDALNLAGEAYESLGDAVCENAKIYIFAEFAERMADLYRLASEPTEYGKLYAEFSGAFKSKCLSPEFAQITERLNTVKEAKKRMGAPDLSAEGERIKVSREKKRSARTCLAECLDKYGITLECKPQKPLPVQKGIVDAMAKLYPAEFKEFAEFYRDFGEFFNNGVFECSTQISLVIGIIDLTERAEAAGVPYCFPRLNKNKQIRLFDVYDIALLLKEGTKIVPNDVCFSADEPFYYLTGANGGGKTTYLRALGNSVLLFLFGAPVFCRDGEACLLDSVQTHFPKDERFDGSGRFADEQKRVDEMIAACKAGDGTGNSLVLLNETYSTTNEEKATKCTAELARSLYESGNLGLYITHQHSVDDSTVPFLGVVVDEQDSNRRTYRIEKRRLKNRSFAADILAKYGITEEGLRNTVLNRG